VFEVEKFDPDSMNQVCLNSVLPLLRFALACPYLSRFVFCKKQNISKHKKEQFCKHVLALFLCSTALTETGLPTLADSVSISCVSNFDSADGQFGSI